MCKERVVYKVEPIIPEKPAVNVYERVTRVCPYCGKEFKEKWVRTIEEKKIIRIFFCSRMIT